jgi:hypothetical protein
MTFKELITEKLKELDQIIKQKDFEVYGFGRGGPYGQYLELAEPDNLKWQESVCFYDLRALAQNYVATKGRETERTVFFRKSIQDFLASP